MGTVVMGGMGEWANDDYQAQPQRHILRPTGDIGDMWSRSHEELSETLRERKRKRKCAGTIPSTPTLLQSEIQVQTQQRNPGLPPGNVHEAGDVE